MKNQLTLTFVQKLFDQSPWAALRLKPYRGSSVTWALAGIEGGARIDENGYPQPLLEGATEGVHLTLPKDRVHVLTGGVDALMREVRIEGNAGLAAALAFIAKNLKPDVAEFLAPSFGDGLAQMIGSHIERGWHELPRVSGTLAKTLTDYGVNEARLLVSSLEFERFILGVGAVRDDLARLDQSIERLARRLESL